MPRKTILQSTLRALFTKSGNTCAFPDCQATLVEDDNLYVAEVCHIEAASPQGPRYNPESTEEERRGYDNLLLLCHAHHRRIDSDTDTYSANRLRQMKAEHESAMREAFQVDAVVIRQVEREMNQFWNSVAQRQEEHPVPSLAVRLGADADAFTVFEELHAKLERVEELFEQYRRSDNSLSDEIRTFLQEIGYDLTNYDAVYYIENPFRLRNWEYHNLGSPNVLTDLRVLILKTELFYWTERIKLHAEDASARDRIDEVKRELSDIAESDVYHD